MSLQTNTPEDQTQTNQPVDAPVKTLKCFCLINPQIPPDPHGGVDLGNLSVKWERKSSGQAIVALNSANPQEQTIIAQLEAFIAAGGLRLTSIESATYDEWKKKLPAHISSDSRVRHRISPRSPSALQKPEPEKPYVRPARADEVAVVAPDARSAKAADESDHQKLPKRRFDIPMGPSKVEPRAPVIDSRPPP